MDSANLDGLVKGSYNLLLNPEFVRSYKLSMTLSAVGGRAVHDGQQSDGASASCRGQDCKALCE